MPRRNKKSWNAKRRHTSRGLRRQIKRGKMAKQMRLLAKRLGVKYGKVEE